MKRELKTFIGGAVIFGIVGLLIGGFVMGAILGTAFLNYSSTHPTACQSMSSLTK